MAETMQFDVLARDQASAKLELIGRNVDKLADKLDALGRKDVKPKITLDAGKATADLANFKTALSGLSNKRVRLDVDMGTAKADVGDLRRELAYLTNKSIKIRVDTADSNQRLKTITDRLKLVADTKAKIDIQVTGEAKLDEVLGKLTAIRDMSPVRVVIDLQHGGAVTDLRDIDRLLGRINGRTATARVDIHEAWDKSLEGRITGVLGKLMSIPAAASAASGGMGVLAASAFSLATGLAEAGGAALIVPGALAAAGAVAATVTLGVQGLDEAFKALADGDVEKLAEVMAGLSPAARELVTEVQRLGPAWSSMQLDVQQRLLAGLGTEAKELAGAYLPSLRSGLGGIATELNSATRGVTDFLQTGQAVSRVDSIFRSTRLAVADVAPAADDVAAALLDVAEVGASMLPELTSGADSAAASFRAFIADARETGQLEDWIQTGIDRIEQLSNTAGNAGGIVAGIYTAAQAEGADFLTMLERGTQGVKDFVRSAEGQDTLRAFFEESRATVEALIPGLQAGASAVSGFVQNFNDTDGLVRFGQAASDVVDAVGPLVVELGTLAGGTLGVLSDGLSNVAAVGGPVIGVFSGMLGAISPVTPAVVGMIAAYAGLRLVSGYALAAQVSLNAFAASQFTAAAAASSTAATYARTGAALGAAGIAGAAGAAARALPLVGVAVIGLSALWAEFGSKAEEYAGQVVQGSRSITSAIQAEIAQLERNQLWWNSAEEQQRAYAKAADDVRGSIEAQLQAMGGLDELQARVAISQKNLNDAVVEFGRNSPEAADAAAVLARDEKALEAATKETTAASKDLDDQIQDLADTMREQAGTALSYAEAVERTRDAHKDADQVLKDSGATSQEYLTEVRNVASAQLAQADAARAQAEALGGAGAGAEAFRQELLRVNDGTQIGRAAFIELANGMDQATLSELSAAAAATGLRTEILSLPSGKQVTVVVGADTGAIPAIQQQITSLTEREYVGEIKINGDARPFQGMLLQSVTLANGTTGTMKLQADGTPVSVVVRGQKYLIDTTTGVMTIDGNAAPGRENLSGFKLNVDQTTGVVTLDANPQPASGKLNALVGTMNTSRGVVTIDGDSTLASGKTSAAVKFADGSRGVITIDGNEQPVNGKIQAQVTYADGSVGTITLDANDQRVVAAQANAKLPLNTTWTPVPDTSAADAARSRLSAPTSSIHTINVYTADGGGSGFVGNGAGGRLNYHGAIRNPDGVALFAPGGVAGRALSPAQTGVPMVAGPNTWRVLGDRPDVNESYIPWKRDKRSLDLLAMTAQALGQVVVPMAAGGAVDINDPNHPSFQRARERQAREAATGQRDNAGRAGYVQAEDGSWVPGSFYRQQAGPGQAIRTEDGSYVGPGFFQQSTALSLSIGFARGGVFPGVRRFAAGGVQRRAARPAGLAAASAGPAAVMPVVDEAYASALQAASEAGAELNEVQALVADTAAQLGESSALTTEQVNALTAAAQAATTADQAYQVGLTALQVANDTVAAAAQTRIAAEQAATGATGAALTQAQAYTGGLAALAGQAAGGTTAGIGALTSAVTAETGAEAEARSQVDSYTGGLAALGGQAGGATTGGINTLTGAVQQETGTEAAALGQAGAYTGGLTTLGAQAGGGTTGGIQVLTGAVQQETGAESAALGQAQAYTGGLTALGGQAGGPTAGGVNTLTAAVTTSGGASVTATGQAQGHTGALATLGAQGGTTATGLGQAAAAADNLGGAHQAAATQAQGQAGNLQDLAGSAGTAAGQLQDVAAAINNLPDGEFVVTATGRMGEITGTPTVRAATGGVLPGYTPGRDVHSFVSPTAGRLELSGGEAVMRPEWTQAVGPGYVHAANQAARTGHLRQFLARTAPRQGQASQGDGSMLATGGVWTGPGTVQRYALGGVIPHTGNPFPPMPTDLWTTLANRMADALTPPMQAAVAAESQKLAGGPALEWARAQVGKPYLWGAVGPGAYDCSGFMSAILNVVQGKPPHSRRGTTATFPWAGFSPGEGGAFTIASSSSVNGGVGHMAGRLGSTNVESSGSVGVRVGGGARGPGDSMFNTIAHVANGGILPSFDRGGLAAGRGLMFKDIIKPERTLDPRTTVAFEQLVDGLGQQTGRVQLGRSAAPVVAAPGVNVGAAIAAVQGQVTRQLAEMRVIATELMARPAITVNDTSGNPVETARATKLVHHLGRRR